MKITYVSPWGRATVLTDNGPIFVREDGFRNMVGVLARNDVAVPGRAGVRPGRRTVSPIKTTLPVHINDRNGEYNLIDLWAQWREDWSLDQDGTLIFEDTHPLGVLTIPARLDGVPLGVGKDLRDENAVDIDMPVFCHSGVFQTYPVRTTGEVDNTVGKVPVWGEIEWEGAGGEVTAPSGAVFTLPSTAERRRLLLDPSESCAVTTLDGIVDTTLSDRVAHTVYPETCPPGAQTRWVLPAGAEFNYQLGVLDPWGGA